ncbi:Hypothetical predicted protein [Octopus vulgaris]|uniref:Uncharacterized protein n=1 Tax=Octopus vulgaris TaxID=6645 RepID=A0AA36BFG8_OCTVU|nr:Hypothetical predicted protein [Octopus vulgaris]
MEKRKYFLIPDKNEEIFPFVPYLSTSEFISHASSYPPPPQPLTAPKSLHSWENRKVPFAISLAQARLCGKKLASQPHGSWFSPTSWHLQQVPSTIALGRPKPCGWIW